MFFHILKRDLKRKKTMNMIMLLFMILATMFISSSIKNIVAISTALDHYFDKAGVGDYFIVTKQMETSEDDIISILEKSEYISSYKVEPITYLSQEQISQELDAKNIFMICAFDLTSVSYFDKNNDYITRIDPGEIYLPIVTMKKSGLNEGDILTITMGETSMDFKIKGGFKDAFLGAELTGMKRFFIHQSDYDFLTSDPAAQALAGNLCYIRTDDTKALEQSLNMAASNIVYMGDRGMVKLSYIMHMVIAGCLLIVSICLILIAFAVLRFMITFTLSEEFREIGIMKAIGIESIKIRGLYLVKYFFMAVTGSAVGLLCGIPFGNMLLQSVSQEIVIEAEKGYLINVLCAVGVVGIILLYCYGCTGKVKKFTPVDAIRNGSNGERYQRKGILRLGKSRLRPESFMACNDIMSNLKRYCIIILTFTLSLLLIDIVVNSMNTLKSSKIIPYFSCTESDVFLVNETEVNEFFTQGGREKLKERLKELEGTLEDQGMPAKSCLEAVFSLTLSNGEYACKSIVFQGNGTTTDQYMYTQGTPPQNENEIAVTRMTADKLHVGIGDTVTIKYANGAKDYIITALFQSMNNMGEGVRLYEGEEVDYAQGMTGFAYQINFTDSPGKAEIERRIVRIKEIFPDCEVYDAGEYIDNMVGVSQSLQGLKWIVVLVGMIICMLVAVLMERSFIARENGEIGILKAVGFRDSAIVCWHTIRIGIILVISSVIAAAVQVPATQLSAGQVFKIMGAEYGIRFAINPIEVFVLYPLVMIFMTLLAVFLTAQYTRRISAAESANID